jgi:phytoene synthase
MTVPAPADSDRLVALGYVPGAVRPAMAALFALDERLGGIVARAREPTIGLMRLVWWRDALDRLDRAAPPAEPLLAALAESGMAGAALAAMTAGWEALLDDPDLGDATVATHAQQRGGRLFTLAGDLLGAAPTDVSRLAPAGAGWALADLARHLDRPERAAAIRDAARTMLAPAMATRWPRRLRPLGQLAALAMADARGTRPLGPRRRVLRAFGHQLGGR